MNNFMNMKYKILFIDEEKEQHDDFLDYMEKLEDHVEVSCQFPKEDLEQMIQLIEDEHPDAIVSDYQLNEMKTDINYTVSYNGSELVNVYRGMRPNFPCFVITSYDDKAVVIADDVNIVYVKNILHGQEDKNTTEISKIKARFCDKIVMQIKKYKKSINDAQVELTSLVSKKQKEGLSLSEEDRLVKLDSFLEHSLDAYTTLPDDIKKSKSLEHLSEVIDKVDEMLAKLK